MLNIKDDEFGGIEIGKLIDEYELPESLEELQEIKEYTLSKEMYKGRLISEDSKTSLIVCRLDVEADKIKTAHQIKEIINKKDLTAKVFYGGIPFQLIDLSDIMLNDINVLIPIISILIILALFFSFRSFRGVILPLLSVAFSTIWTLGVMSLLNIPLTVISNIIPVILMAVGSAYSIHVINKFNESVVSNENRIEQSKKALGEISIPVLLASITTVVGFAAFVFGAYLDMIRDFGLFSGLGIFFAFVISITFVPSILSIIPVIKTSSKNETNNKKGIILFMDKIGVFVLKNERIIIICGILFFVICILGIPKIQRSVDMLDYFKKGTNIRLTERMMEHKFGGSIPIQILVKGDIQDPVVLSEMKKFEDFLNGQGDVKNPQSIADLIEEMNDVMGDGKVIPDSREKITNLWFLLEGEDVMSQLVNSDYTEAVIQATIVSVNSKRIKQLVNDIKTYLDGMSSSDFTFTQTGMHIIYYKLDDSIMKSQVQSLIIALILIFLIMMFQMHSVSGGLMGLIPIFFTLASIFGVMGYFKIPLDIATVLVGSISIGIGIDYSIHFINRFKKEFQQNHNELEALSKTLETTGRAIVINVITVMLGFLVLIFANLIPLQRFGILVAITMIGSGIGAITLLPAVILITKAKFVGDWSEIKNGIFDKTNSVIKKTKLKK
ncbi:MAG: MMPL family transporter [Candidatus Cloacimonadales bacterium]|nr:MMPL family transporter [Candidatus Cloacimonadales bacterium]